MREVYPYLRDPYTQDLNIESAKRRFLSVIDDFVNQRQYVKMTLLDWEENPIKAIKNGMIQLDNNYYVTGIRIEPKNIFILDYQEQNNIIFNLRNFYNVIDYEFWLVVCDRPVDINMYMAQLQLMYANTQSQQVRKLIQQDIDKGESFRSTTVNAVDTEYYILFRDKKKEVLQKRIHTLISNLATSGLNSRQVSDDDLRVIIDSFFNGNIKSEFGTVMSSV